MPKKAAQRQSKADGSSKAISKTRGKGRSRTGMAANRREEIIEVSARLFAENGFEATSVRQIAKAVDILSGSLYHHFATKEEILHEILRKAVVPMTRESISIARSTANPEEKLSALIILRLRELTRDYKTFGIIYNNRNFFRGKDEFAYVEQAKTEGFEAMSSVLQEGIDSGVFKSGLDIYLTIGTIFRLLSGAADWFVSGNFVQLSEEPREYNLESVIDYHLDFILSAIRASKRKSKSMPKVAAEKLLENTRSDF